MLQESAAVRFLHVAMLQHDPEGRVAFMHRTAEGKFYPSRCCCSAVSCLTGLAVASCAPTHFTLISFCIKCAAGLTWLSSSVSTMQGGPHASARLTVLVM